MIDELKDLRTWALTQGDRLLSPSDVADRLDTIIASAVREAVTQRRRRAAQAEAKLVALSRADEQALEIERLHSENNALRAKLRWTRLEDGVELPDAPTMFLNARVNEARLLEPGKFSEWVCRNDSFSEKDVRFSFTHFRRFDAPGDDE